MREHIQHLEAIIQQLEAYEQRVNVAAMREKIGALRDELRRFPLPEQASITLRACVSAASSRADKARLLLATYQLSNEGTQTKRALHQRRALAHEVRVLTELLSLIERESGSSRCHVRGRRISIVRSEEKHAHL